MKCLVLGGAGFIGSHIVDALVERGHEVRVFDLPNISKRNLEKNLEKIELVGGDFDNANDIARALEGIDAIVHLICTTLPAPSNENPVYDVETNVVGTLNLLNQAVKAGVRKIVFGSSGGTVYGIPEKVPIPEVHPTNPICSYGITKLTIEKYLELYRRLHGLDSVVLRMANPYGERQSFRKVQGAVAVFLGKTFLDETIEIWGDGSVARDYFYIGDLLPAVCHVIENETPSSVYNIGSGESCSLNALLETIRKVTGKEPNVEFKLGRPLDVDVNCLDIARAKAELGWAPKTSLEEGLKKTWDWLQSGAAPE